MPLFLSLVVYVVTVAFNTHLFTSETAEPMKSFITNGDLQDLRRFTCVFKLSYLCWFCSINSVTSLNTFYFCGIYGVMLHRHSGT